MRIRKGTSLFLAILLLISNFGLAFNVHYCGDKIASLSSVFSTIQIEKNDEPITNKCCCARENKNSCCKDKVVDLNKEMKEVVIKTFSFQTDAAIVLSKSDIISFAKEEKITSNLHVTEYYCISNTPPLFKLYQQYVFYA
jgi:hypothetical protein